MANDKNLTHLVADDLFSGSGDPKYKGAKQIFDAKTGKWIKTLRTGEAIPLTLNFDTPPEPEEKKEPEFKDPNQGSLF